MSWKATAFVAEIYEGITGSEKLVLMCLSNRYNDDEGCAWCSVARLAKESIMSERTCHRALDGLIRKGFIVMGQRPGQTSCYLITGLSDMGHTSAKLAEVSNWVTASNSARTSAKSAPTPDSTNVELADPPLTQLWQTTPDTAMADERALNGQLEPQENREQARDGEDRRLTLFAEAIARKNLSAYSEAITEAEWGIAGDWVTVRSHCLGRELAGGGALATWLRACAEEAGLKGFEIIAA